MSGGINVNWDQVEGKWKQVKGSFKERWGKFTDDDLDQLAGKRDQIVGKMQEKYGVSKDLASKDLDTWRQSLKDEEQMRTSGSGTSSR
ncbi:MAG: CsbD family protein [Bryobacterales bacterium]|nr:CsbD family protein [Bryobacterales bacterium]